MDFLEYHDVVVTTGRKKWVLHIFRIEGENLIVRPRMSPGLHWQTETMQTDSVRVTMATTMIVVTVLCFGAVGQRPTILEQGAEYV